MLSVSSLSFHIPNYSEHCLSVYITQNHFGHPNFLSNSATQHLYPLTKFAFTPKFRFEEYLEFGFENHEMSDFGSQAVSALLKYS